MQQPITCVFFGKSGSGKGTQAQLLIEKLKAERPESRAIYVETGDRLRNFTKSDSYTAKRVYDVIHAGKFLPPFIPIWIWTSMLVDEIKDNEHLIFDGVARQPEEGPILDSALQFYGRVRPTILLLEVSHDEAKKRLLKRGRHDDESEKIDSRIKAFETSAMPSVRYFEKSSTCDFVRINGEQSIEAVFKDICKALGL